MLLNIYIKLLFLFIINFFLQYLIFKEEIEIFDDIKDVLRMYDLHK